MAGVNKIQKDPHQHPEELPDAGEPPFYQQPEEICHYEQAGISRNPLNQSVAMWDSSGPRGRKIADNRRLNTVPPAIIHRVIADPMDGATDV